MAKQILTQLSTQSLQVGTGRDQFEVVVNNLSDRFATFILELSAPGIARDASQDWYHLTPDISAKIPAGDQANFVVNLLALPPVAGDFTGKMNLNVNVTCLEIGEKDRQIMNLVVKGSGGVAPQISMATTHFQGKPGDLIEIPLLIQNYQRNTANIQVEIKGLPEAWLIDGHKHRLSLPPRGHSEVLFICQLPSLSEACSQVHSFQVEVSQIQTQPVRQAATLEVLPVGALLFNCDLAAADLEGDDAYEQAFDEQTYDEHASDNRETTHYTLTFNNASNVAQSARVVLNRIDVPWYKQLWAILQRDAPTPARTTRHCLHISPSQVNLQPGDISTMAVAVMPKPPWWGWRRRQQFQLRSQLQKTRLEPSEQRIELVVSPRIPFWLQCLALFCLSVGLGLIVNHWTNHRRPVNSIQFDGQASRVISGANDIPSAVGRYLVV